MLGCSGQSKILVDGGTDWPDSEDELGDDNAVIANSVPNCRAEEISMAGSNLCWHRCATGEYWNGAFCEGYHSPVPFSYAQDECSSGYSCLPLRNSQNCEEL